MDGIKTRGTIGMALCIIKALNDVRQKFFAPPLCLLVTQALYCHLSGYIKE